MTNRVKRVTLIKIVSGTLVIYLFYFFFLHYSGKKKAVVNDARYDMCSRNAFRYDDLKDSVKLTRARDHFICKPFEKKSLTY